MKTPFQNALLALLCCASVSTVHAGQPTAKTRQTVGPVYEIVEPSIYEQLQRLIEQKRDSGELAKIEKEGRERSERSIRSPEAVSGIHLAHQKRSWTYDPSVVATADVRDHEGRVIVARGMAVSPLDQVSWKPMVFFDQRDAAQVRYAQQRLQEWNGRGKAVLVAGNWIDLTKQWKQQVYFDQKGALVERFGITAVPATVVQQGRVLLVSEVPPESTGAR
jgi:conjugal transfer pilus assembly protein TraW